MTVVVYLVQTSVEQVDIQASVRMKFLAWMFLGLCFSGGAFSISAENSQLILDYHNADIRANVDPTATNMRRLV